MYFASAESLGRAVQIVVTRRSRFVHGASDGNDHDDDYFSLIVNRFNTCTVRQCGRRHDRYRVVFDVAPNQMDRDNVTAMETDKLVDEDIGHPQVSTILFYLLSRLPPTIHKNYIQMFIDGVL